MNTIVEPARCEDWQPVRSQREVAAILGFSLAYVQRVEKSALRKLKSRLKDWSRSE